jgi:hypothetical protein
MQGDAQFHSAGDRSSIKLRTLSYKLLRIRNGFTQRRNLKTLICSAVPPGRVLVQVMEALNTLEIAFQGQDIVDLL